MESAILLSQATLPSGGREDLLAYVLLSGIACYGLWRLLVGWASDPVTPDPWPVELDEAISRDDAQPLCPFCLEPHVGRVNFCDRCGAPIGEFVNFMPFERVLSEGHFLRHGATGNIRPTWPTALAFGVVALAAYNIFAPVYWIRVVSNVARLRRARNGTEIVSEDSPPLPPPIP